MDLQDLKVGDLAYHATMSRGGICVDCYVVIALTRCGFYTQMQGRSQGRWWAGPLWEGLILGEPSWYGHGSQRLRPTIEAAVVKLFSTVRT